MATVERSNVLDAGETGCCGRTSSRSTKAKFANFAHYAAKGTWDFLDDILPYIPFVNFFYYNLFSDELSIDDLFHGINMVSLLNALFLTISCVVPASFNHEDMAEMNTRTYAGPDIWESVFLAEDVLDMRQLNVSRPSYEIDAGISLPSLEGCWGCRDGVMYTVMRDNFDMSAPPSILLAHGLAIIFTIQTLSLFLGLLLTLSAGPVRSAKPFYKIEEEAEDEVAAGEGEKEKSTKATDGFGFGSDCIIWRSEHLRVG